MLDHAISSERVLEKLSHDKKFGAGKIRFVLLRSPGDAYPSNQITPKDLAGAVAHICDKAEVDFLTANHFPLIEITAKDGRVA